MGPIYNPSDAVDSIVHSIVEYSRVIMVLHTHCGFTHTNTHFCADKKGNLHDMFPADCTCRDLGPFVPFELKCIKKDCNSEKADLQPESNFSITIMCYYDILQPLH